MLLYLQFLVFILSLLTTQVKAGGDFLQPWRAGRTKDYSENLNYAVGTRITFQWFADFGSASIDLVQDNHPGSCYSLDADDEDILSESRRRPGRSFYPSRRSVESSLIAFLASTWEIIFPSHLTSQLCPRLV